MEKNAAIYFRTAQKLKFNCQACPQIDGFQVRLAKHHYLFRGSITPYNACSSAFVAENKYCMNKLLAINGFPVPKAVAYKRETFQKYKIDSLLNELKFPLVVKPTRGTVCGTDVLCNITRIEQLKDYMTRCFEKYDCLSIEEFHKNLNSYRVLVFYQKIIGVVQRFSARVIGDNKHTIEELIAISNKTRLKLMGQVSLGLLKIDEESLICLKEVDMTPESIPSLGQEVLLCYTCNSTRGGTMQSLGKSICKENADLLCAAARVLDLNIVGFDIVCEDILVPMERTRGVIIEANYNPDVTIHEHPMLGTPNRVSTIIMRQLIKKHPLAYFFGLLKQVYSQFYIKIITSILAIVAIKILISSLSH